MIIKTSLKIKNILEKLKNHSPQGFQELTEFAALKSQNHSCFRCKKAMFSAQIQSFYKVKNRPDSGIDEVPVLQFIGCQSFISHPPHDSEEVGIKPSSASVFICSEEMGDFEMQDVSALESMSLFNKLSESQRPVENLNQYPRQS